MRRIDAAGRTAAGANPCRCYAAAMSHPKAPAAKDPDACATMADVRAGVDAVDRDLIALLGRRFGYMRAAARIKPERAQVRDEARKAQVVAAAAIAGEAHDIPREIVARLWDALVEESIAYELARFDER